MKTTEHNSYADFCDPSSVQRDSRFLARMVAAELGFDGSLVSTSECKHYADSLGYTELAPALTEVGKQIANELVKYQKSPAVQLKLQALSALLVKTFPVLGKGSVRHDVRKTEPTPSRGIDPDTFTTANRGDVYAAFGFGPKAEKASALSPIETAEFATVDHTESANMADIPEPIPLPVGASRSHRGDVTYTPDGALQAAQHYAAIAVEADRKARPEGARAMALTARLHRVSRIAKALRADLDKARAELTAARAELTALTAARLVPAVTKRTKRTAVK